MMGGRLIAGCASVETRLLAGDGEYRLELVDALGAELEPEAADHQDPDRPDARLLAALALHLPLVGPLQAHGDVRGWCGRGGHFAPSCSAASFLMAALPAQ